MDTLYEQGVYNTDINIFDNFVITDDNKILLCDYGDVWINTKNEATIQKAF